MLLNLSNAIYRRNEDKIYTNLSVRKRRLVTGGEMNSKEQSMLEIHLVSVGDKALTGVYANHQRMDSSP